MVDSRLLDAINAGNRSAALGDMPEENIIKSLAQGAYRNFTLPEDVRTGRVDPLSDEGIIRALELGSNVGLGNIPKVTRGRMVESNSLVDDYFKNKNKSAPELSHEDFGKQVRESQADDDLYTQKPFIFDDELPTPEQLDAIMKELNPGIGDMPEENIIKSLAQGAYRNLTLPEDVRTGRVDPLSDGGIIRALELGSSVGLGNIPKVTRGRMVESNSLVDDYFKNKNKSAPELSHEDFGKQVREFQADDDLYTQKPFEFDNELPTLEQLDAIMKELNPGIGDKAVEVPSYYKGWPKTGEEYVNMGEQLNADEKAGKISIVDSIKRASELAKYYQDNIASKKSVDITGPISDYKTPSGQLDWDYRPRRARRLTFEDQFVGPPDPRRELPGDPISRAMEQGYKGPLYTGVNSTAADAPVYGFSDPRGGDKWSESGIFLTDRPDIAENYAHKGMTIPVMARMENPKVVDMGGKQYQNHWMDKHIEDAIRAGHDSMIINNMHDLGGEQTQYVILEPNRLRSPWANFDPMLKDSRNLLSGTAAGAVGVNKLLEWINQDKENRM